MHPSLYDALMPAYRSGLNRLLGFIDRTADHMAARHADEAPLLGRSLANRLHPLGRQILAACGHAELDTARIAGLPLEARAEPPMTLASLRARVEATLAFLDSVPRELIDGNAARTLRLRWNETSATDYVHRHSIPHFYFHLTVVYVTLRQLGVPVGKSDFVGAAA